MRPSLSLVLSLLLLGCGDPGVDEDEDGVTAERDCDDSDPSVNPKAPDPFGDGFDQNCDQVDGVDKDGDGVASFESGGADCDDNDPNVTGEDADNDGAVSCVDCDDADPLRFPGADETCNAQDDDCDGTVDVGVDGLGLCSHVANGGGVLDLLFVVDNSCSMQEEQASLANAGGPLLDALLDGGTDFHLGVVSTDSTTGDGILEEAGGRRWADASMSAGDLDQWVATAMLLGIGGSATEQGRDVVYKAVDKHGSAPGLNAGFFRPDAHLAVVYLSDEDDYSALISLGDFVPWFTGLKPVPEMVSSHAIATPAGGCTPGGVEPGQDYLALVNAHGGLWGSICDADYSPLLIQVVEDYGLGGGDLFPIDADLDPATLTAVITDADGNNTPVLNVEIAWNITTHEALLLVHEVPPGGTVRFYFGLLPI